MSHADEVEYPHAIASSMMISAPRYSCSKHGETDAVMCIVTYKPMAGGGFAHQRIPKTKRNYCCECFVEALDRLGVEDMKQIS